MKLHPDFSDLLAAFAHEGVRYLLLGGYAVGLYAEPRATKDLDLLVSREGDNLERVARALAQFGAPANVVEGARSLGASEVLYMGVPPVRVDVLAAADGIDTEAALARALVIFVGGLEVPVIALDDLLANKRAAGRPQDLADVVVLERVRALLVGGAGR